MHPSLVRCHLLFSRLVDCSMLIRPIQERQRVSSNHEEFDLEPFALLIGVYSNRKKSHRVSEYQKSIRRSKHVESITTTKIPKSDTLASKPSSSEPILPLRKAEHRPNSHPCHSFSQELRHTKTRRSFKVATTCHDMVAGTYKRLPSAKHSANKVWIPSSGLPVLTWSSHALRKNKSAKETDDFSMSLSAFPPFPLVCLKV
jgi:hypothetical protein